MRKVSACLFYGFIKEFLPRFYSKKGIVRDLRPGVLQYAAFGLLQ